MMSGIENLFAEHDAIAAMPEETLEEYAERLSARPVRRVKWIDKSYEALMHSYEADRYADDPRAREQQNEPSIAQKDPEHDPRRSKPGLSFRPFPAGDDEINSQSFEGSSDSSGMGEASNALVREAGTARSPVFADERQTGSSTSPSLLGSDTFTLSPRSGKRKLSSHLEPSPAKRRALSPDAAAEVEVQISEPDSPIQSFSRAEKRTKVRKRLVVDQGPQLQLVPITEIAVDKTSRRKGSGQETTAGKRQTTNPDDIAARVISSDELAEPCRPNAKRAARSEPTVPLETEATKGRVARQAPTRQQRPKVVRLAKTDPVLPTATEKGDESSIICISSSPSSRSASPPPPKKAKTFQPPVAKGKGGSTIPKATSTKGKKEKPKLVSPREYAELILADEVDGKHRRKGSTPQFLQGYNVFYTGGERTYASETTRNRMQLLVRHGANLIPQFDPEIVTHIVTEGSSLPTLSALGLKSLKEISSHIPTVRWTWVTYGMSRANTQSKERMDELLKLCLIDHAAFADRCTAGMDEYSPASSTKGKGREKIVQSGEASHVSNIVQVPVNEPPFTSSSSNAFQPMLPPKRASILISPSTSLPRQAPDGPSTSRVTLDHDPLAEYYEQAKVERAQDEGFLSAPSSDVEEVGEDKAPSPSTKKPRKSRYVCDNKEAVASTVSLNQDVIDKLTELMELHRAKPGKEDYWRAFAYSKAIRALKTYPRKIGGYEEARKIKGVGEKTAQKIAEILETGDLRRIGYEKTEDVEVARLFQGIYGVGRTIAYKWYSAGCRTLDDLRQGKYGVKLSSAQEVGLKFYDDINDRMPRGEAEAIYNLIEPIALSIEPKLFIRIMGSFRRGKATCGDIDILITRPIDDGKTHSGVLPRLLSALHAAGILTEDLALPDDPYDLETTYRGLCRIPDDPNSRRRRIDILSVPWVARGAALLYYTGDDIFNRAMRFKAGAMGYSLNQRGLYAGIVRDPHDRRIKLTEGHIIASETEEEIFKVLEVPWQEPHERVRG